MNAAAQMKPVRDDFGSVEKDHDRVQRVAMGKDELEVYIQDSRPKGALFKSVADLKGMNAKAISAAASVPIGVVQAVLQDGAMSSVTTAAVIAISEAVGINLQGLCMSEEKVHVFDMRKVRGANARRVAARAAGLLMRSALVAKLDPKTAAHHVMEGGAFAEYHAAQSGSSRAIFVTSTAPLFGCQFDLSSIPSARWVGGKKTAPVPVESAELTSLLRRKDLNRNEFAQLFKGAEKTSWNAIQQYSREHNISRSEVMELMKFASGEFEQKSAESHSKNQKTPFLRLVSVKAA